MQGVRQDAEQSLRKKFGRSGYADDAWSYLQGYNVFAGRPINLVFEDGIRDVGIGSFTCGYV